MAQVSPTSWASNPTTSGPAAPASDAALLSDTARPLRPGRLEYSSAISTGYHGAVAMLRAASAMSFGAMPGTSRKTGNSTQIPER